MYGQSCQDASSLVNNLSRCFVFCQLTMHVYLHLLSKFLHVHVNMYVWSKLSRCFVFSQQPVKMFHLLSVDHACIFAFDKYMCLHVHVNMYVWSKLSRCIVFSQQPVKMFRLCQLTMHVYICICLSVYMYM